MSKSNRRVPLVLREGEIGQILLNLERTVEAQCYHTVNEEAIIQKLKTERKNLK